MHKEIAKYAENINSSIKSTKLLFSYTQQLSFTEAISSLARIFDTQFKNYEIRCINRLLNHINRNSNHLPAVREIYQTAELLRFHKVPLEIIHAVENKDSGLFSKVFAEYYLDKLRSLENLTNELKFIRDKAIAHNERREEVFSIKWTSMDRLLDFAKELVGVTVWAYMNTVYKIEERYLFTDDARYDS